MGKAPTCPRPTALRIAGCGIATQPNEPLADNRCPYTRPQHMTDTNPQDVPNGFTQLTEGRIRTTDIIFFEPGGWAIPHVFLVGGDIGQDGRRIARPHVK